MKLGEPFSFFPIGSPPLFFSTCLVLGEEKCSGWSVKEWEKDRIEREKVEEEEVEGGGDHIQRERERERERERAGARGG